MDIFRSICMLLAGIAVFLLGIKLMSSGLQSGAGKGIKKLFARIGDNRFVGVGVGAGATATVQSSTAVTVMVVGFVNAGVMTLHQAAAIIMGANIGTTFTAFFGAMGNLPITPFFMATGIVGIFMYMFAKKDKVKLIGQIITGFAVLFVGINLMSGALRGNDVFTGFFENAFAVVANTPVGPLLLFLLGTLFTAMVQSSTATTVMIVTMVGEGIFPPQIALPVILGANLGTCLTALIASIGASANAKRAACIHLSTDIFGFVLFLPIIWIFGRPISDALIHISGGNNALAASFFHLFYNLIMISILIWLIKPLVKLVTKIIPGKGEESDEPRLFFIDEKLLQPAASGGGILKRGKRTKAVITADAAESAQSVTDENSTPEAIENNPPETTPDSDVDNEYIYYRYGVKNWTKKDEVFHLDNSVLDERPPTPIELTMKETLNMAQLAHTNIGTALKAVCETDVSQKNKITNTEQKINYINKGIGKYLVKLSADPKYEPDKKLLTSLHHVISDIERIGDHAMDFLANATEMAEHKIKFSDAAIAELNEMLDKINEMFTKSLYAFEHREKERLPEIASLSKEVDEIKRKLGFAHISRLNNGECNMESGAHFYAVVTGLERIADHLSNIAFSIKSLAGQQLERLKQLSKEQAKKRAEKTTIYW